MKEQDAAHSFEKGIHIICQECNSQKAIHYANDKYFCSGCFAKEYTRLRSELQREHDKVRNQAIQEAITKVKEEWDKYTFPRNQDVPFGDVILILEALKTIS